MPTSAGPDFTQCLQHLVALENTGTQVLWGGDFNFVAHTRDTDRKNYDPSINYQLIHWLQHMEQTSIVEVLQSQFQDQGYTRHGNRLDKFFCSASLLSFFNKGKITTTPEVRSDHRPILCTILGKQQKQKIRKGTFRRQKIPTEFRKTPSLLQQFCQKATKIIDRDFRIVSFDSWEKTKSSLSSLALNINQQYKQLIKNSQQRTDTQQVDDIHIFNEVPQNLYPPKSTAEGLWTSHQTISRSGTECANILVEHYANVSAEPCLNADACQEILNAIPDPDTQIFPNYSPQVEITERDVIIAPQVEMESMPYYIESLGRN
jgi:hypothetical protein